MRVFSWVLLVGAQSLARIKDAHRNKIPLQLGLQLGVKLVQVQASLRVISMVMTFDRALPGSGG